MYFIPRGYFYYLLLCCFSFIESGFKHAMLRVLSPFSMLMSVFPLMVNSSCFVAFHFLVRLGCLSQLSQLFSFDYSLAGFLIASAVNFSGFPPVVLFPVRFVRFLDF